MLCILNESTLSGAVEWSRCSRSWKQALRGTAKSRRSLRTSGRCVFFVLFCFSVVFNAVSELFVVVDDRVALWQVRSCGREARGAEREGGSFVR